MRSELAIKTCIQLAKEAGCAQLFNCPVTAIRHDDDGVTIETADGEYQAKKAIVCAGHGKDLLPQLPVQPVRKVFAWYQADGRYSVKNNSRRLPVNCPMAINIMVFRQKNDALKIGKHNGGQVIHSADERVPFAEVVSDGSKPSRSCAMSCRVSVAACTALPAPMIIRLTKILLSIPYPVTIIHCSLPA
ncbi:FAD-dependent oxidoreductase [Shigella flexneri]